MKVVLANPAGQTKQVKLGLSWTAFFFGAFVPLFRGNWKWFFIMLVTNIVLGISAGSLIGDSGGFVGFLVNLVWLFFYNKWYVKDLYNDGYRAVTPEEDALVEDFIS
ncbi:hypothetical protein AWM75_03320 [Aerococcus urinaehominis]|uniref:Uncharacterized protein n=1 Tax=Aerococcus urinaehominis TaxID=128944 RepID=A0A0X8FKQ2_9LACT|nr:hypothetical protein [Aerococcus urinaehominis]AMB99089.1 hypothetical protein AWM75_03320 [Aerococcus urinaehominis]SDM03269.1 hypothetical protein SAMN04487985_10422 [Aerococcus urinaehominis]